METELKLQLDAGARAQLARAPELAAAVPRRRWVTSVYYDTPECELAAHGMALRVRRDGRRWIEGLKAAPGGAGGLHQRQEWEFDRRDAGLDLAKFAHTPLADLPDSATLHARLAPLFTVRFLRTTWLLDPAPGSRLEVALDAGFIECAGRREEISELEIECLQGEPGPAFDLAAKLLEGHALRPSAETKAQRGYQVYSGAARKPVKARSVHLERSMARLDAARVIVAAGLEQLQANEEGVLRTADAEFVHQARIALRRTRSALRMFRGTPGFERAELQRGELGEVARALGSARDWDVFAKESLPAAGAEYGDARLARSLAARARRRRLKEREAARAALRSRAYARAILELARWLATAVPAPQAHGGESLTAFAARVIRKRHHRLLRDAAKLATLTPEERHRVRIDVKRLRYGTDGLASLFPSKRVEAYLAALSDVQDALGRANDAATAMRLMDELGAPQPFAAFARGWFSARSLVDPALLAALLARIAATPRFWRHGG
ncbi:MAG: CYTH and CHAD domain-containing protein [Usitatibacter sp.]